MTSTSGPKPPAGKPNPKAEKRAAALRSNLLKRKQQVRARSDNEQEEKEEK